MAPFRDVFAALFFVSIGMLFDPGVLAAQPALFALGLAIVLVLKPLVALGVVLALRGTMRTALTVAVGLAQIGEFSFILAVMGITLKLLPPQAQQYIVAGALLSIMLNPLVFAILGRRRAPAPPAAGGTRTT
jgi:CPA2 family monovalent cation:H+ antiporter-2